MNTNIDLHRFEDQVSELEKSMNENPPRKGGILFYGSSTMANWRQNNLCQLHMKPLPITNHGFGGATVEEALYYYHRLVIPVRPAVIACYFGPNDIGNNYTPAEVLEMTHRFFEWCRQDFPGVQFLVLPAKSSPGLKRMWPGIEICNDLFKIYAKNYRDTHMVNLKPLLFDKNGKRRTDIYVEDELHHNTKGYELLAKIIKPILAKLYSKTKKV